MNLHLKKIDFFFSNKLINFEKLLNRQMWIYNKFPLKKKNTHKIIYIIQFLYVALKRSMFSFPLVIFSKKENQALLIKCYSRNDIDKHSRYYEKISGINVCTFNKRIFKIDLISIFLCFFFLIKYRQNWLKTLKKNNTTFFSFTGLKIIIDLFDALSDLIKIFPIIIRYSKLISFQEMVLKENLICQIAKLLNIKTFALQHSIYTKNDSKNHYPRGLKISDHLSSVSDNILCWGNFTKNIYKKHTNADVFVVGKAFVPNYKKTLAGVTIIFETQLNLQINKKLYLLYEKLVTAGIPVSRWFKPGHNNLVKNIQDHDGPLRKIAIGCNSSLLFELGYYKCKVFVTEESNIVREIPNKLVINENNFISKIYKISDNYPHHVWKNFIECNGKNSIYRFKKIINIK